MHRSRRLILAPVLVFLLIPTLARSQGLTEAPARPADVETLDGIIAAFYDVISTPPGGTVDWGRDSTLYLADVRFTILGPAEDGGWSARRVDHDSYARESDAFLRRGFIEGEIHRETNRFGPMAQVFSTYEWRPAPDAPVGGRGINGLELFHDGARWWIVAAMWATETRANPIPREYLPGPQRPSVPSPGGHARLGG